MINLDAVYQYGTANDLREGNYAGYTQIKELMQPGIFGLGAMGDLDGEVSIVDGKPFKTNKIGFSEKINYQDSVPFAVMASIHNTKRFSINAINTVLDLEKYLPDIYQQDDYILFGLIRAKLNTIKYRGIGPLTTIAHDLEQDILQNQGVYERTNLDCTLLVTQFPPMLNQHCFTDCHLHFVSKDETVSGHVLDASFKDVTLEYQLFDKIIINSKGQHYERSLHNNHWCE